MVRMQDIASAVEQPHVGRRDAPRLTRDAGRQIRTTTSWVRRLFFGRNIPKSATANPATACPCHTLSRFENR